MRPVPKESDQARVPVLGECGVREDIQEEYELTLVGEVVAAIGRQYVTGCHLFKVPVTEIAAGLGKAEYA